MPLYLTTHHVRTSRAKVVRPGESESESDSDSHADSDSGLEVTVNSDSESELGLAARKLTASSTGNGLPVRRLSPSF